MVIRATGAPQNRSSADSRDVMVPASLCHRLDCAAARAGDRAWADRPGLPYRLAGVLVRRRPQRGHARPFRVGRGAAGVTSPEALDEAAARRSRAAPRGAADGRRQVVAACRLPVRRSRSVLPDLVHGQVAGAGGRSEGDLRATRSGPGVWRSRCGPGRSTASGAASPRRCATRRPRPARDRRAQAASQPGADRRGSSHADLC